MNKSLRISSRQILVLCTIAYASIYIARHNLSIASPLLTSDGYMTVMEIGLMGSIFFVIYAAGRFVYGYIGDMLSPKRLLVGGLALVATTNVGISFLPPAPIILSLWGINALAQSMLWGPSLRMVNEAYINSPHSRLAAIVLSTSIGIGSLLAIGLSSLLVKVGLWSLFAVPGLIVAGICLLMTQLPNSENRPVQFNLRQTLLLFKKKGIICMLFPSFAHGMIKENLVLWAPLLFLSIYGIDLTSAALFVFMMPAAMLLGRLIYPLAERLCSGDERLVSMLAFGFCILCLIPFVFLNLPLALAATLLALAMLGISIINVAFMAVYPIRYGKSGQISMVAGLLDSISYVGSAAGSALFAWIIIQFGYALMLGIYIIICLVSIGSMLPLIIENIKQRRPLYVNKKNVD